jgi:hypothetical protein
MGKSYRNNDEYSKKWAGNRKKHKQKVDLKKKTNFKDVDKNLHNDVD